MRFVQATLPCCKPALQIQPANFHLNGADVSRRKCECNRAPYGARGRDFQAQLWAGDSRQFLTRFLRYDLIAFARQTLVQLGGVAPASFGLVALGQGHRGCDNRWRQFRSGCKLFQEFLAGGRGIGVLQQVLGNQQIDLRQAGGAVGHGGHALAQSRDLFAPHLACL